MLHPIYLATAAAVVAGLLHLLQTRIWPLTTGLLIGVLRSMAVAFVLIWLFATLYNHLMVTA